MSFSLLQNEIYAAYGPCQKLGPYSTENYKGVKGLTIIAYWVNENNPGQALIDLSYTAPGINGANWTQWLTITTPNGKTSAWDTHSGTVFYYTDSQIKAMADGYTIYFHDSPWLSRSTFSFEAVLALRMGLTTEPILVLSWGYRYNHDSRPMLEIYPIEIFYQKQ